MTDKVFVESLSLSANIGPDWWGRPREQPVLISVYLTLQPSSLDRTAETDDVSDTVNYGTLSKTVTQRVEEEFKDQLRSHGLHGVAAAVTHTATALAGGKALEVKVRVEAPKAILLADGLALETVWEVDAESGQSDLGSLKKRKVLVKDLILAVIIGVNPPEREAKQRVILNLEFEEALGTGAFGDYPSVITDITQALEASSYLTLEKFAMQAVRIGCLSSEHVHSVTARAQKPSAISFAHSSGVEITRPRAHFLR
ncbi:tetrahydrobiopterin biosynthesis enzymes-like protein [Gloeophyllum trabeum ATCC 11539]|uniref:dihydroneopterin aldolase n=1 Tax=Gloeophyllum trabeum (strain ATCC 11539 / FP-39264 / Madison 617) TaxID=670483 RepID=S7RMD1_GLOTA|nr:tetrahydrobiopterin biosynthesis enzymes-like protein [Gloeophyllum trabeum ATCC 11539]EPQ55580.1 tetrahydrobiopterin biosynthesis enzymes-like protein [Gloeophyllum trabeum ATCC 11539]